MRNDAAVIGLVATRVLRHDLVAAGGLAAGAVTVFALTLTAMLQLPGRKPAIQRT